MRCGLGLSVLIFSLAFGAGPASAATKTFTGAVNTKWFEEGNWSPSGVPTSSDDVVINSGTVEITGQNASARSLSINTGSPSTGGLKILDHTLTVSSSGESTLDGFLEVNGTLSLNDPTTYEGTTDSNGINIGGTLNIGSTFTMTSSDSANHANMNDTSTHGLVHVLTGGSLIRETSTGVQSIQPVVDNDGSAESEIKSGTLNLEKGDAGTSTGGYEISSGATLQTHGNFDSPSIAGSGTFDVAGGTTTIGANDSFTVPDLHIDNNGTLTLEQDLSIPTLVSTNGHRNGTGALTVTEKADLSGLALDTGETTVAASVPSFEIKAFLSVGTSGTNATLNLETPTTYKESSNSNGINLGKGVLNIASTFTMSGAGVTANINDTGGGPLVHVLAGGSLIREAEHSGESVGIPQIENDGTVSVKTGVLSSEGLTQAEGTTTISGGAELDGAETLDGGELRGSGTLGGSVSNPGGTVAPGSSPGKLTIDQNYTQGAGGTLAEQITGTTPGTQFDQLSVGGALTLGGTLAIDSTGFTPALSDTFKIISGASSRSGSFASVTGALAGPATYVPQYDPDGATLAVMATPPPQPPSNTGAPSISGTPGVNQTLTCEDGSWTNSPTGFAYQWSRDGVPIPGATSQTYSVQSADQGHTLTCTVIASNAGGPSQPATSAGVAIPSGTRVTPPPSIPKVSDFVTAVFEPPTLYLRLKCPARFKPGCVGQAVAVTAKDRCTTRNGKRSCEHGKPMSAPVSAKQKPSRWKVVTLTIRPQYVSRVAEMAKRPDEKLLVVRQLIHSTGFKHGQPQVVFHTYRVRSAISP